MLALVKSLPWLWLAQSEPMRRPAFEERARAIWTNTTWGSSDLFDSRPLIIALAILAVLLVVLWAHRIYRQHRLRSAPLMLFHQTSGGMGLSITDQLLLIRIARAESLPSPLTLLISPATLRHHGRHFSETQTHAARARTLAKLDRIALLVFGEQS